MDKIMDLLNNLEHLEKFIPKLDTLMGWAQWLISLAVRVGPVCILILGLIYLLIPPKEANRKAGYRTYFGMGSILAWRFTQRVAGLLMTVLGLILTILAYVNVGKFAGLEVMEMADIAIRCIKTQVICSLILVVFIFILTTVMFDRHGYRRFAFQTNTFLDKFFFLHLKDMDEHDDMEPPIPEEFAGEEQIVYPEEESPEDPQAESEDFDLQGKQVITADDIVIEGLYE